MFAEHSDQIILSDVERYGDDIDLGDRHVIDAQPPQIADAVGGCNLHDGGHAVLRHRFGGRAFEQAPQKPALRRLVGLGGIGIGCGRRG
jgi:hypothetical protein